MGGRRRAEGWRKEERVIRVRSERRKRGERSVRSERWRKEESRKKERGGKGNKYDRR